MGRAKYKRKARLVVVIILLVSGAVVAYGYHTGRAGEYPANAPPADNPTVITTQTETGDDSVAAYYANGTLMAEHSDYDTYWDVDPSPEGRWTVLLAVSKQQEGGDPCYGSACQAVSLVRLNLSTGDTETIYEKAYPPGEETVRWHDVDRIDEDHYVVADVASDQVFLIDTENGTVDWAWMADQHFAPDTGGSHAEDWTHLNDVDVINDTTFMVSIRNQDSVVFVHKEHGVINNMTLGEDANTEILNQQHNPDYIPEERGGPAVVVADSMNDRIVEYELRDGSWERTWIWQDKMMQWPRDADRLPSGNTLISDSNADRVFEVNPEGEIVWQVTAPSVYEAERLRVGDESANGTAAEELGYEDRTWDGDRAITDDSMRGLFPQRLANAFRFVTSPWFGGLEMIFTTLASVSFLLLFIYEVSLLPYRPTFGIKDRRAERIMSDDDDEADGGDAEDTGDERDT